MNDKIEAIQQLAATKGATLYAIIFRNAGVAFHWHEEKRQSSEDFRSGLIVYRYYPTLEDALVAETLRLEGWQ